MGVDRDTGLDVGRGGGAEDRPVALGRAALAAGDLHDPGPDGGPPDDRPAVVALIDTVRDVGDEEVGELVFGRAQAPVRRSVEALVVEPGRGHDPDPAAARQLGKFRGVAAAVGRHRVDRGLETGRRRIAELGGQAVEVRQQEVRRQFDGTPAVDDEVLVGVRHAELIGVDVTEHCSDERHAPGPGSGETETTDQPPSILSSCPVTTRDSSDRK